MSGKVLVLRGDTYKAVGAIFASRGYDVTHDASKLSQVDLVVFTGGSDVSPYVYGEEPNGARGCDSIRDDLEVTLYHAAKFHKIPCVGICRGGQLLNVLNGGKMIQDLAATISGDVEMDVFDGRNLIVRVDHHQGILAREDVFVDGQAWLSDVVVDYAVWYPETKDLCFQPHPEWGHKGTEEYFFELVKKYIGDVNV